MTAQALAIAAQRLAPGMVAYMDDTYDSIRWRTDTPPTRNDVETLAASVVIELKADAKRAERNKLLAACDWTQVADAPVDRAAWATYRQQLRDLPDNPNWPEIDFPDPPA